MNAEATYLVPRDFHPPYPAVPTLLVPGGPPPTLLALIRKINRRPRPLRERRVICRPYKNRDSVVYRVEVKGPKERVVLGTFSSETEARAAGETYLQTGVKPPPRQRGRKKGQRSIPSGVPKGVIEVPEPPRLPRVARAPKAPEGPDPALAAKAARLEMIKRIARRLQ